MLFFGFKFSKLFFKAKDIILYPIQETDKSFNLSKVGKYSICLLGGGTIKHFSVNIISNVDENINVVNSFFKYKFTKNGVLGVSYFDFDIKQKGNYLLRINNPNQLSVKSSMLKSRSFFENEIEVNKLSILIKEYSSPFHFIYSLLLIIIGLMIFLLNIVYLLYNLGIIRPT
jgi:hypothetical protein